MAVTQSIVVGLDPDPHVTAGLLATAGRIAQRSELALTAVAITRFPLEAPPAEDSADLVYWEGAPDLVPLAAATHWQGEQEQFAAQAAESVPAGVACEVQVRSGRFVAELERAAEERRAGIIALSGPSNRRWERLHQENDVLRLVHHTRRLVLVVPRSGPGRRPGPIRRIMLAVDGLPNTAAAADAAAALSRRLGAEVRVVQAWEQPRAWIPALESPRQARDRVAALMGRLRSEGVETSGVVRVAPEGLAPKALVREALDCRADLIVRATRGLGPIASHVLKGVTRELLGTAPVPVLVVR